MRLTDRRKRFLWLTIAVVSASFGIVILTAGRWLVVDAPQPADAILVLAGETDRRPARALELLQQGYARKIVMDVPADAKIYKFTQVELAREYIQDLPQRTAIAICQINGLSTRDESREARDCLEHENAGSVLIVTSDFHTRRALSIFCHELRGKPVSVAAARNDVQFGLRWWTHRQWAKTAADEWLRLLWWEAVDRWR
jgi:uncharacterized SAM-binding protein YcdF (DUF218 family)